MYRATSISLPVFALACLLLLRVGFATPSPQSDVNVDAGNNAATTPTFDSNYLDARNDDNEYTDMEKAWGVLGPQGLKSRTRATMDQ